MEETLLAGLHARRCLWVCRIVDVGDRGWIAGNRIVPNSEAGFSVNGIVINPSPVSEATFRRVRSRLILGLKKDV